MNILTFIIALLAAIGLVLVDIYIGAILISWLKAKQLAMKVALEAASKPKQKRKPRAKKAEAAPEKAPAPAKKA